MQAVDGDGHPWSQNKRARIVLEFACGDDGIGEI